MPILRYFTCVGAALIAALFVSSQYLPQPQARADNRLSYNIAIHAHSRLPQAVSFSGESQIHHPKVDVVSLADDVFSKSDTHEQRNPPMVAKVSEATPVAKTLPTQRKLAKLKPRKPTIYQYETADRNVLEGQNVAYTRSGPDAAFILPRMFR